MNGLTFFSYWLTFALLALVFSGVIIFAAFRAGYFKGQDRARYLALWAEVPEEKEESFNGDADKRRKTGLNHKH
jgi:hypothetical protein